MSSVLNSDFAAKLSHTLCSLGKLYALQLFKIGFTEELNLDRIRSIISSDSKIQPLFEYLLDTISSNNVASPDDIDYINK